MSRTLKTGTKTTFLEEGAFYIILSEQVIKLKQHSENEYTFKMGEDYHKITVEQSTADKNQINQEMF